ncbi:MAG TPA: molybdopterin-guanine dinucleotide biosynthesis protein B [Peptococcaceae bacterium]|nr:molybdopterin-guanine dinucleotide biosynthesis protein B [Peptococcaceae bacterium]
MSKIPLVCIVAARSGTGKTTFMEKLIAELVGRGYRVGAIKSDSHGFEIDVPGKDSWRFAQAGARATAIIGPDRFALIQKTQEKKDLDEVAALIQDVDLILVEGYKAAEKPRIEVIRKEMGTELVSPLEYLIGVVTDLKEISVPVPVFALDDYAGIADLLIGKYLRK